MSNPDIFGCNSQALLYRLEQISMKLLAMSQPPHALDYQVRPDPRRRKALYLTILFVVLLLIFLGAHFHNSIVVHIRQYQQMRADRAAMAYEAPAGQVVWDDMSSSPVRGATSSYRPMRNNPQVFMHGRKTTNGQEALVQIELVAGRPGQNEHLAATLFEPASINRWTRHHGPAVAWEASPIVGGPPKKIFAGQYDPKDVSHFTIEYVVNGETRTLEGWLIDIPKSASGATIGIKMTDRAGTARK